MSQFKKFVSEDEIEQKRAERQEEWEKVRKAEDPLECPEEEVCNKTLFEQLEAQKLAKQDEIDEKFKLKNQVRGLDEGESEFLDYVSDRQVELQKKRDQEEMTVINEYKKAVTSEELAATSISASSIKTEKKAGSRIPLGASQNKSQSALLSGALKRKSVEKNGVDSKKRRHSEETENGKDNKDVSTSVNSRPSDPDTETTDSNPELLSPSSQTAQVLAILPGIGEYTDTSESDSSSSDSDIETDAFKTIVQVECTESQCDHNH